MTWTKLSDDFADDCWTLSDEAFRLHVEALVWSARKLLDCRIPKDDIGRLKNPGAVDELLAVGWWSEDASGYLIRHHATYQRSREQELSRQAANIANGRKGGRPRHTPETQRVTDSLTDSLRQTQTQMDGIRTGKDLALDEQPRSNLGSCIDCHHRERLDDDGRCLECQASAIALIRSGRAS